LNQHFALVLVEKEPGLPLERYLSGKHSTSNFSKLISFQIFYDAVWNS